MPYVHLDKGFTIGSVIPPLGAIIPAAVGVDIGCGMMAAKTTLSANDLPDNLGPLHSAIERGIPHGMTPKTRGYRGRDEGSWNTPPAPVDAAWAQLKDEFDVICQKTPKLKNTNNYRHLGTLGGGNHFIEVCLDGTGAVRVVHAALGFTRRGQREWQPFHRAGQKDARTDFINLPDDDLAYLEDGTSHYQDYVEAVEIPMAYKDSDAVMHAQRYLVEVGGSCARPQAGRVRAGSAKNGARRNHGEADAGPRPSLHRFACGSE